MKFPRIATMLPLLLVFVFGLTHSFASAQPPSPGDPKAQVEKPAESKPLASLGSDARYDIQGEATFIFQNLFAFHSPYSGAGSLRSHNEAELSHTYTLYLGIRPIRNLEFYINPEIAWGGGVGQGQGLAGASNGDIIGQSSLRPDPYLARYFIRWRIPTPRGRAGADQARETQAGRAPNLIEGSVPAHRLVVTVGKIGVADIFDVNAYANNPRTQFLNNAFGNNLAYDYPQETRGYDLGAALAWVHPSWTLRVGTFAMPTSAGGPDLAYDPGRSHSEQIELEIHPRLHGAPVPAVLRLLAFRNVGFMGSYRSALANRPVGGLPDITLARAQGTSKYGIGLNFEQALADGGATGIFGRAGWNDGETESYSYAEADRFVSFGGQLSGAKWGRKDDRLSLAFAQSGLSGAHRDYLAAGGQGLTLGDGAIRYGAERTVEGCYSYQFSKALALSADAQLVANPGCNRDRGPLAIFTLRAHWSF